MQQQSPTMMPVMPSFSSNNTITTEQIQKYLDENKKLILAILENQNLGKLAECAQYQAQLQKNLMYLAAIADAQPQAPAMPTGTQMPAPHPAMQQGAYFMHPQAAAMAQQSPGIFPPKMAMPFGSPHQLSEQQQHQQQQQLQQLQQQHQQAIQGQMNMRPGIPGNGMHQMQSEPSLAGGISGQNKRDASEAGPGSDEPGSSGGGRGGNGGDGSEKGN